ncbi:MAG: FG-GAP repeat domain-containing protein [Burkholderiaceae bacterium]
MRKTMLAVAMLILLGASACTVLTAGESSRPAPPGLSEPTLVLVEAPFVHQWSKSTSHPLLAAAAIDIDRDGRDEVFLGGSDGQSDALLAWRNGQIVDIAQSVGLGDQTATYGALSLDFNTDGNTDLLTAGKAGLTLWLNQNGRFDPQPLDVVFPDGAVPLAITAGDYDRDGLTDLYVSLFINAKDMRSPVFNDPTHAKSNLLLRGAGNHRFLDVSDDVTRGLQNTFTASFVDLDNDLWPDLVLAQNTGEVEILHNQQDGTFRRVDLATGFGFWMGLGFADLHATGRLDFFLSNSGNSIPELFTKGDLREDQRAESKWLLLKNDGEMRFADIGAAAGLTGFGFGWGGLFEDVNLDGALDLLVAENYVKWPIHKLFKLPGKLLLGGSVDAPDFFTSDAAQNKAYGHVPLLADFNGDGKNDIVWANMDGAARIYLNETPGRFLAVRLPDNATSIGARIQLEGVKAPVQVIIAGEGLTSDRTMLRVFGLPESGPVPSAVVINWADGHSSRIDNPALNEVIVTSRSGAL